MNIITYYGLWSYVDDYTYKKKEFCFDEFSYMWVENGYIFSKNDLLSFSYDEQDRRKKEKCLIIYYKEKGYESDIIGAHRMWLVKDNLKKQIERFMKDKGLAKNIEYEPRSYKTEGYIEFLPVKLFPLRYKYKGDEIKQVLSNKKEDKDVVGGYYIMNVLNRVSNKDELRKMSKDIKEKRSFDGKDFIMLTYMGRYITFSERIKKILEKADLGIYEIVKFYSG